MYYKDNKINVHKNKELENFVKVPEKSIKVGQEQNWTKWERLKHLLEFKLDRNKNFLKWDTQNLYLCLWVTNY